MEVKEAMYARHSCRAFTSDPVDRDTILSIIADAQRTPSWANSQPWRVFVAGGDTLEKIKKLHLQNGENSVPGGLEIGQRAAWPKIERENTNGLYAKIAEATAGDNRIFGEVNKNFFYAPVIIVLCLDRTIVSEWPMYDIGAFSQSLMLAATDRGLATIVAAAIAGRSAAIRKVLDIPDSLAIAMGIAIGYEDKKHPLNAIKTDQRPVEDIAVIEGLD